MLELFVGAENSGLDADSKHLFMNWWQASNLSPDNSRIQSI
jgi:hypothetical protein